MAKKERSTLKSYFRTGNIPNQLQYEDLIDSNLNLSDTEEQTILGDLVIQGAVDINNTLEVNSIDTGFGAFEVGQDTRTTDSVTFSGIFSSGSKGNITASGAISASGQVSADNLFLREGSFDIQTGNDYTFNPSSGTGTISFDVGTNPQTITANQKLKLASDTRAVEIKGHVTASISGATKANISASGTIIANSGSFASQVNAATGSFTQLVVGDQTSGTSDLILKKFGRIALEDSSGNITDLFVQNSQDTGNVIGNFAATTYLYGEGVMLIASASGDGSFGGSGMISDITLLAADTVTVGSSNASNQLSYSSKLNIFSATTASAPISCSAKITADTLQINGSEVDFTNLPTSDPGVSGRLYNDSGTVKISAG